MRNAIINTKDLFGYIFICGYTAYCCRKMIYVINFATTWINRLPPCILILSLNNAITQSHYDRLVHDSVDVKSVYYRITGDLSI